MLTAAFRSTTGKAQGLARGVNRSPASQSFVRLFSAEDSDSDHEDEESANNGDDNDAVHTIMPKKIDLEALPITFADISRAEVAIRGGVKRTTCEYSPFISELVGANVWFKNEFRQYTGSFKERGARNAILQLMRQQGSSLKGVIAASAGNHAQALGYHGRELGIPVTVVMPLVAPMAKVDKCRVSAYELMNHLSLRVRILLLLLSFCSLSEIRGPRHYSWSSHWRGKGTCRNVGCQRGS